MSPKPWAKTEVGYMGHQKFLALTGNAISLWHEGKDYCARHQTDGFIPKAALLTFRFRGQKSIAALTTSCGLKPNGEPYAPLWETSELGYTMHDFLDHNDCRDTVLARIDRAEAKRDEERERKAAWRAQKAKLSRGTKRGTKAGTNENVPRSVPCDVPLLSRSITEAVSESEDLKDPDAPASRPHPVREFLALYDLLFFELTGEHPQIVGGRDGRIAKTTIAKYTEEKARNLLESFFSSSDPFIQNSGYGLNIFSGQINKLLAGNRRPQAVAPRQVWQCPHVESCGHRAMCDVKLAQPQKYPVRQVAS